MLSGLKTLITGIAIAVAVVVVAAYAVIYVIGVSAKAALFGDPRITLAQRFLQRVTSDNRDNQEDQDGS